MEQNKYDHPPGCRCMMCGGGQRALRWILGIIILLIVFCLGWKLGEISSFLRGGYYGMGPGMMQEYGNPYYYGYGPGMMGGYGYGFAPQQSTTAPYYGMGGMMRYYYPPQQATTTSK